MRNDFHGGHRANDEFEDSRIYWRTQLLVVPVATAIFKPHINVRLHFISNQHNPCFRGGVGFLSLCGKTVPPAERPRARGRTKTQPADVKNGDPRRLIRIDALFKRAGLPAFSVLFLGPDLANAAKRRVDDALYVDDYACSTLCEIGGSAGR